MQIPATEVFPKKSFLKLFNFVPLLLTVIAIFVIAIIVKAPAKPAADSESKSVPYLDPLPQDSGTTGLKEELRRLQDTGRLMMVTAHPDDEDGGVLTLEARGKGVHALLMTLTRGEGGQNELGSGLFGRLGVLRTLEQLASDKYYGVDQRFSRVADFGYSKTPEETFQKWGGHDVPLADMVRVIREFRPDVLVARFSGTDRDGHGHHQASAMLTKEAFRAAADPNRFPEQIKEGLQPWQTKKLYVGNVCGFGVSSCPDENWTVKLSTGDEDSLLGMSYTQFAIEGLRHQKSQGLGDIHFPSGPRYSFYKLEDSALPKSASKNHETDLFDGIDTSLAGLASRLDDEQKQVSWLRPELSKVAGEIGDNIGSLASLQIHLESLALRIEQSDLSDAQKQMLDQRLSEKIDEAARALNLEMNVTLEATVAPPQGPSAPLPDEKSARANISPGQTVEVLGKLHNGSKYWLTIESASLDPDWAKKSHAESTTIGPGEDYYANFLVAVPSNAPLSRPYWHRDNPETDSINKVDDERYATHALSPPPIEMKISYGLGDHRGLHSPLPDFMQKKSEGAATGRISAQIVVPFTDDHGATRKRELAITPAVSVALEPGEQIIPVSGASARSVEVGVSSTLTKPAAGTLRFGLPDGWRAKPNDSEMAVPIRGETREQKSEIFPNDLKEARADVRASLKTNGQSFSEQYSLITREDIGSFYFYQPAVQHISVVDVKVPENLKIGYIMGAGDDIPTVLQQIGMSVTPISPDKLANADLSPYGTIVLGVRAYETQAEIVKNNQKLLDFVSGGGTLIVQNNNDVGDFNGGRLTPYPATLSRARVSVEEAPVTILAPDNPIFHTPNEITQKDFDGWVQERGLYFMSSWDDHFKPLLSCHDPNEPEQKGGLLVAKFGKGTYIYTGYAFFRQLPAGVPGAIRLFVNLVSAK